MSIPRPGTGRVTLALLAVIPVALAYPWQSPRDYWLLGIAAAVVVLLFGWWRGLYFTTILRRGLAILGRRRRRVPGPGTDTRATELLRVGPPPSDSGVLPLPLIARYLNCYGIRADKIRITSRDTGADELQTWIGLTVAATHNLAALQARSSRIPLHETAQVAARRLADHLREIGWEASTVAPEDIPRPVAQESRETWNGVRQGDSDYVAAYRVSADRSLPETMNAIRSYPARETWTVLEIAGDPHHYTVAAACAFRTDTRPGGGAPLDGLTSQRGSQLPALLALDPVATQPLDGHTDAPADLLTGLTWPAPAALSRT
ncbi:ESX-3 secretion system protein EccE3 [Mycobacterium simulans]|uniref:type VII secretion protein EccE n=1 Tax=Mycobacterium simulans TaxID=627089 RepID=UPI001748D24E|nr:type VII secretion protein EccE [Mycobacterium simulans]SON59312.1 ESX-3 secretion system protein EccE3 [Mycobacterium simulans]